MKLQINQKGSWRDVATFDPAQLAAVQAAVIPLARALCESRDNGTAHCPSWRIAEEGGGGSPKVIGYCQPPGFAWRKP